MMKGLSTSMLCSRVGLANRLHKAKIIQLNLKLSGAMVCPK